MTTAPLLSVTDLTGHVRAPSPLRLPGHRRALAARRPRRPAGGDPRGRRRDRVGQDHAGPRHRRPGAVRPAAASTSRVPTSVRCKGRELRTFLRSGQVQLAFQDPLRALDPDLTVGELVGEPLAVAGVARAERIQRVAESLRPRRPGRRLVPRPLPPPALGRPAPARVARPRDRDPAAAAVLRRARQRARRVQPQPRAPAARPAPPRPRPRGGDHRPRPQLARRRRRPRGRLLPRPAGRAGTHRRGARSGRRTPTPPCSPRRPRACSRRTACEPTRSGPAQADASWDATACVFASLCRFAHEACTRATRVAAGPAASPTAPPPATSPTSGAHRLQTRKDVTRMTEIEFIGIAATQEVSEIHRAQPGRRHRGPDRGGLARRRRRQPALRRGARPGPRGLRLRPGADRPHLGHARRVRGGRPDPQPDRAARCAARAPARASSRRRWPRARTPPSTPSTRAGWRCT